jgi:hypothetical protein
VSGDLMALVVGTVLAVGALAYVLQPLFFDVGRHTTHTTHGTPRDAHRGLRETRKECYRCGLRPEPDAIFCSSCGAAITGDEQAPSAPEPPAG